MIVSELKPLDSAAALVVEARWDRPNVPSRLRVTDYLRASYEGETIEKANGGDILAKMARDRPSFLQGYARISEGAGVALYRRGEATLHP